MELKQNWPETGNRSNDILFSTNYKFSWKRYLCKDLNDFQDSVTSSKCATLNYNLHNRESNLRTISAKCCSKGIEYYNMISPSFV